VEASKRAELLLVSAIVGRRLAQRSTDHCYF